MYGRSQKIEQAVAKARCCVEGPLEISYVEVPDNDKRRKCRRHEQLQMHQELQRREQRELLNQHMNNLDRIAEAEAAASGVSTTVTSSSTSFATLAPKKMTVDALVVPYKDRKAAELLNGGPRIAPGRRKPPVRPNPFARPKPPAFPDEPPRPNLPTRLEPGARPIPGYTLGTSATPRLP